MAANQTHADMTAGVSNWDDDLYAAAMDVLLTTNVLVGIKQLQ